MLAHTFAFCVRFWLVSKSMSQCTLTGGAGRPINSVMRQTQAALIIAFFFLSWNWSLWKEMGKVCFMNFSIYLSGKTWVSMAARTSSHFCRKTSSSFPGCFDLTCEDIQIESLQELRRWFPSNSQITDITCWWGNADCCISPHLSPQLQRFVSNTPRAATVSPAMETGEEAPLAMPYPPEGVEWHNRSLTWWTRRITVTAPAWDVGIFKCQWIEILL